MFNKKNFKKIPGLNKSPGIRKNIGIMRLKRDMLYYPYQQDLRQRLSPEPDDT